MKSKFLFFAVALILKLSCQNPSNHQESSNAYDNNLKASSGDYNTNASEDESFLNSVFNRGKKTHEFRDARTGLVVNSAEYPSNWKIISKPVYTVDQKIPLFLMQIQGPNNLQTFNTPIHFYIDYPDPQMAQWMRQYSSTGKMIRPMISNQQIMQQEVNNRMANSGFSLIGRKQIPRAERFIRDVLNKNGGQQAYFDHYATKWTNNKGQKALVTLVKIAMEQPILGNNKMRMWFYSLDYIFVDENKFDETINQMLDITENTKENQQWKQYVAELNRIRGEKAKRQHQINMQNRQAAFNAHQKKMQGIWAAQDANHASFMNRNFGAGSDIAQKQFVNMINEEETVYNSSTGKNYQVNAGSLEYWMDSDGNYINNNNLFYNPNGDINLNHKEWTKVKKAF